MLAALRDYTAERYKVRESDDPTVKRLMAQVARTSDAGHIRAMIDMAKSEPGISGDEVSYYPALSVVVMIKINKAISN